MPTPTAAAPAARDLLRLNLVFRRAQLRLSQAALAERAGVSRPVISEIENGRANVSLDVLERIAAALEATVATLFTPAQPGASDADIERRAADDPEAFVDAYAFLAALDEGAPAEARYSNRGRKSTVRA